jgi:TonB-dependent receptor
VFGRAGTAATSNPTNPANYVFDQILLVTEDRSDEILAAKLDLTRAFELGERSASIKLGAKANRRDKVVDREERVGDPSAPGGIPRTNLGALPLVQAETNVPNWTFQPELGAARALFNSARGVLQPDVDNSAGQDFAVKEDVDAAYIMGSIDLTEDFRLFGGVRAEWTTWETNGRELETLEPLVGNDVLTVRDIAGVENTYTDILPSVHFRWVARPGLLVRGALSTALIRPNFDEGAATREISTEEIAGAPGTYERTFEGGNPLLDPLKALQADLSVAWFPSDATYLYAGLFYKRIEDFFVEGQFLGADVGRLGLPVGNGTINGGFDVAEVILNGDRATVRGLEIAFERYFVNLPGWWRGLFVSGNVTLLDSESTVPLLRPGETLPLIDQADRIGNLSLGWENERFTLRLSGNYRSDQIDTLNSNPLLDQILQEFVSYDVNLRWNVTDAWQIYADGINLNARKDATVFRGDANGPIPADEAVNDFGRSYALGLRVKF